MTHDTNLGSARLREAILQSEAKQYGALPEAEDELQYSGRYIRKINSLCRKPSLPLSAPGRRVKKYAAVALLTIVIFFTGMLSVLHLQARSTVAEWFINVYESFTEIFFSNHDSEKSPTTIESLYAPTVIPDGYTETKRHVTQGELSFTWEDGRGNQIIFIQTPLYSKTTLDNEDISTETVFISDKKCMIIRKNVKICVCWNNNDYAFSLIVPQELTQNEWIDMISSVGEISAD